MGALNGMKRHGTQCDAWVGEQDGNDVMLDLCGSFFG
jgi:hypothetical protein